MPIKFTATRVSLGKEWCGVHYTTGPYVTLPPDVVTVYCKRGCFPGNIRHAFAAAGALENNSDMMTDYFENDKLRIFPSSPFYSDAAKAAGIL